MKKQGKKKNKFTVLLATSNSTKEKLIAILDKNVYQVKYSENYKKALEFLLQYEFDAIIVDPDIEELKGPDGVQIIKKINPQIPIIVVSGKKSYETDVRIAKLGVYYRLGKPMDEKITKKLLDNLVAKIPKN